MLTEYRTVINPRLLFVFNSPFIKVTKWNELDNQSLLLFYTNIEHLFVRV